MYQKIYFFNISTPHSMTSASVLADVLYNAGQGQSEMLDKVDVIDHETCPFKVRSLAHDIATAETHRILFQGHGLQKNIARTAIGHSQVFDRA